MAEKKCFVIAPIGEPKSETRKRSDQILKHIINPATKECGYKAIRADQISEPGRITSQVIQRIIDDPLVIADLTGKNPNVFYELAIRHAIRKPFIQLIDKKEQLPFDVADMRTIQVDHHDLDSVEESKKQIINQIRSLEKNSSNLETPISTSLDLQLLRSSDSPEQRSMAEVIPMIQVLTKKVSAVESNIEFLANQLEKGVNTDSDSFLSDSALKMYSELLEEMDAKEKRTKALAKLRMRRIKKKS